MGGQGPASIAGSVLLQVAETMGWAVVTRLHKPGGPIAIHQGAGPIDMRTGIAIWTGPATTISTVMMNQMLREYQIPIWSNAGFASNSKKIDFQAGFEKSTGTLMSALSGGHLHLYQGGSSSELLYSPELAVMEDDVARSIGRVLEGPDVTDETLAIDVINQVGPIPGHYLGHAHTREWWQKENCFLQVADNEPYSTWVTSGKKDMLSHAKEKAEEILATHKPIPLTEEQETGIEEVLNEAREYYRNRGMISDEDWADYVQALEIMN